TRVINFVIFPPRSSGDIAPYRPALKTYGNLSEKGGTRPPGWRPGADVRQWRRWSAGGAGTAAEGEAGRVGVVGRPGALETERDGAAGGDGLGVLDLAGGRAGAGGAGRRRAAALRRRGAGASASAGGAGRRRAALRRVVIA